MPLTKLRRPKANQFFRVAALPYLGSGKLVPKAIKSTALELSGASPA